MKLVEYIGIEVVELGKYNNDRNLIPLTSELHDRINNLELYSTIPSVALIEKHPFCCSKWSGLTIDKNAVPMNGHISMSVRVNGTSLPIIPDSVQLVGKLFSSPPLLDEVLDNHKLF